MQTNGEEQSVGQGERIKAVRLINGLTQEDMAASLGLSKNHYWKVEQSRYVLGEKARARLISAYHVDPAWLATGEGRPPERCVHTVYGEPRAAGANHNGVLEETVAWAIKVLVRQLDVPEERVVEAVKALMEKEKPK